MDTMLLILTTYLPIAITVINFIICLIATTSKVMNKFKLNESTYNNNYSLNSIIIVFILAFALIASSRLLNLNTISFILCNVFYLLIILLDVTFYIMRNKSINYIDKYYKWISLLSLVTNLIYSAIVLIFLV